MKKIFIILTLFILCLSTNLVSAALVDEQRAYYKFDTNNIDQPDVLGLFNADVQGATFTTDGKINGAYIYDDSNSEFMNISSDMVDIANDFSVSVWVNVTGGTDPRVVSFVDDINNGFEIIAESGGDYGVVLRRGGSDVFNLDYAPTQFNEFVHIVYTVNGSVGKFYLDGILTSSIGSAGAGWGAVSLYVIGIRADLSAGTDLNGTIDELGVWNKTLTQEEVTLLYSGGAGNQYPYSSSSFTSPTPDTGSTNNTQVIINVTCILSTDNATLWFDNNTDPTTMVLDNINSPAIYNTNVTVEQTYFYKASCDLSGANSTVRTWTYDVSSPIINFNPTNAFSENNDTTQSNYNDILQINLTFTDNIDLFAYEVLAKNEAGTIVINLTNQSISGTSFDLIDQINISAFTAGVLTFNISVSDSHTANRIKEYSVTTKVNEVRYNTFEGNDIKIWSEDAVSAQTLKFNDRYQFTFDYPSVRSDQDFLIYHIETRFSKIIYREDSEFMAHFVIWNPKTNKGNWIDFENPIFKNSIVIKVNDYHYIIKIATSRTAINRLTFNSIGGLNTVNKQYTWYRGVTNVLFDSSDLVGDDSIITLNITINDSFINFLTAGLRYNDVSQTITRTNFSGIIQFQANVTLPSVPKNYNFTWVVNVTQQNGTLYNFSLLNTQSVENFTIDFCSPSFNNATLNISLFDEINQSNIVGDISGTLTYWVGSDNSVNKSLDMAKNDLHNFTFCLSPNNAIINAEYEIAYSATDYQQRRFKRTQVVLNNIETIQPLYLLNNALGIFVRFKTVDQFSNPIIGVLATAKTIVGSILVDIESDTTDAAGLVTFWANPDQNYDFTFSQPGFTTVSSNIRPTAPDIITIIMQGAQLIQGNISTSEGINYFFTPPSGALTNGSLQTFTFNLTSAIWDITTCSFVLVDNANNVLATGTTTFTTRNCFGTVNLTLPDGIIIARGTIIENSSHTLILDNPYTSLVLFQGNFSLMTVIDDLSSFGSSGFNDYTRVFLALLGTVIGTIIVVKTGFAVVVPRRTDSTIMWIVISFIFLFSFIGWLTVPFGNFPSGTGFLDLNKFIFFYTCLLAGIGMDLGRGR